MTYLDDAADGACDAEFLEQQAHGKMLSYPVYALQFASSGGAALVDATPSEQWRR